MKLNTIYNEDCLEGMKMISDRTADLIATDDMKLMILTESVKQPEHAVVKYIRHIGDIQGELVDFRQIGDQCDATLLVGSEKLFIQNVKLSEIEIISSPDIHKASHLLETTMCGYNRRTYMAAMGATLTEEEKQIVAESEKYIKQYEAEENKRLLRSAREDFEQLRDIPNMPEEAIDILQDWTLRDDDDETDYDE